MKGLSMVNDNGLALAVATNGHAWTRDTDIETAWRREPVPSTVGQFADWLQCVVNKVQMVGYMFNADRTLHYPRLAVKARENALCVWCVSDDLPELPARIADPAAELMALWEWAAKWLKRCNQGRLGTKANQLMQAAVKRPLPDTLEKASTAFGVDGRPCIGHESISKAYRKSGGRQRKRGERTPYTRSEVARLIKERLSIIAGSAMQKHKRERQFWECYLYEAGLPGLDVQASN